MLNNEDNNWNKRRCKNDSTVLKLVGVYSNNENGFRDFHDSAFDYLLIISEVSFSLLRDNIYSTIMLDSEIIISRKRSLQLFVI